MMNKYKKKLGKVYNYDGEAGHIVSNDDIYYFSNKDLIDEDYNNEGINIDDYVNFIPNIFSFADEKINIARFIEKENKKIYKKK